MTDCLNAEMRDRLPELANDSLAPARRVLVLAHIASCAACTAEIAIVRRARSMIIESAPTMDVAAIVSALPRPGVTPIGAGRPRSWASSWRIAAAITVLAAGAGSYAAMRGRVDIAPIDSILGSAAVSDSSAGLALTGALDGLSEAELSALVEGLGAIEALPDPDVESEVSAMSAPPALIPDSVLRDLEGT